jgi:hypothetical protein
MLSHEEKVSHFVYIGEKLESVCFLFACKMVLTNMYVCIYSCQRKLAQRSERVKSVDLHPTEPW